MDPHIAIVFRDINKVKSNFISSMEQKLLDTFSWYKKSVIYYCLKSKKHYKILFKDNYSYIIKKISILNNIDHLDITYAIHPLYIDDFKGKKTITFLDVLNNIETLYSNQNLYSHQNDKILANQKSDSIYFQSNRVLSYALGMFKETPNLYKKFIYNEPVWVSKISKSEYKKIYAKKMNYLKNSSSFNISWGGAVNDWYYPEDIIESVYNLNKKGYNIKLIFPAMKQYDTFMPKKAKYVIDEIKKLDKDNKIFSFLSDNWLSLNEYNDTVINTHLGISAIENKYELEDWFSTRNRYRSFASSFTPLLNNGYDIGSDDLDSFLLNYEGKKELQSLIVKFMTNKQSYQKYMKKSFHTLTNWKRKISLEPNIYLPEFKQKDESSKTNFDNQTFFTKLNSIIKHLQNLDGSLSIYGAGSVANIIIPSIKDKIEFVYDNNPNQIGSKIFDLEIHSGSSIQSDTPIIVTIFHRKQQILKLLGDIKNDIMFVEDLI